MQNVHNILYIRDDTYYMCKSVYSHDIVVYSVKSITLTLYHYGYIPPNTVESHVGHYEP